MTNLTTEIHSDIQSQIHNQLADQEKELLPCFYAVTGSRQYGTNGASSDIDIKGFHCADGSRYMVFETPKSQFNFETSNSKINRSIEITSYELKKFGEMLIKSDFSIIELISSDMEVYTRDRSLLQGIEEILAETWPAELPVRYLGMADSIYTREIEETTPTEAVDLKPYVYSLRGCLAAEYVQTHDELEPRLQPLANQLLDREQYTQMKRFIDAVRNDNFPDSDVLKMVESVIADKLDTIEAPQFDDDQRIKFKQKIAEWMLAVRRQTDTR